MAFLSEILILIRIFQAPYEAAGVVVDFANHVKDLQLLLQLEKKLGYIRRKEQLALYRSIGDAGLTPQERTVMAEVVNWMHQYERAEGLPITTPR